MRFVILETRARYRNEQQVLFYHELKPFFINFKISKRQGAIYLIDDYSRSFLGNLREFNALNYNLGDPFRIQLKHKFCFSTGFKSFLINSKILKKPKRFQVHMYLNYYQNSYVNPIQEKLLLYYTHSNNVAKRTRISFDCREI